MLNSKEYRLLDVGGTFIKTPDSPPVSIPSDGSMQAIGSAIRKAIGPTGGLKGVGVAIPGPFDYENGIFRMEHKFAAVKDLSFRDLARLPENIPLRFHHDVNALLRGSLRMLELQKGVTALVTLGTGLGFSYAIDGDVQYNATGSPARNLWNLPYKRGILEDAVSARGLREAYARKTGDTTQSAYTIARKAYLGEFDAMEAYHEMGDTLGHALVEIRKEIPFDTLVFGGQISKSLDLIIHPLHYLLEGTAILAAPEGAVFEGLSKLFA